MGAEGDIIKEVQQALAQDQPVVKPETVGLSSERLERIAQAKNLRVRSVKRSASASPATGSAKAHELEQKTLLTLAFATTTNS